MSAVVRPETCAYPEMFTISRPGSLFKCSRLTFYPLSNLSLPNVGSFAVLAARLSFCCGVVFSQPLSCHLVVVSFFLLMRCLERGMCGSLDEKEGNWCPKDSGRAKLQSGVQDRSPGGEAGQGDCCPWLRGCWLGRGGWVPAHLWLEEVMEACNYSSWEQRSGSNTNLLSAWVWNPEPVP